MTRRGKLASLVLVLSFAAGCVGATATPAPSQSGGPGATAKGSAAATATSTGKAPGTPTPAPATPKPTLHLPSLVPHPSLIATTIHGSFAAAGTMKTGRAHETVTKLKDGRVLILGGLATEVIDDSSVLATAEIYNPATGTTTYTAGHLITPRYDHFAALLNDGRVLVAGGYNASGGLIRAAELFNPATGAFSAAGNTPFIDYGPCNATTLKDGRVLFAGGWNIGSFSMPRAVVYDPAAGTFTSISMTQAQCTPAAVLLPTGNVLIVGGMFKDAGGDKPTDKAQLFYAATNTFGWTGTMSSKRVGFTATLLPSNKVLIAGGKTSWNLGDPAVAAAQLYNVATGWFGSTGSIASLRANHTATLLSNGKVLLAGGAVGACPIDKPAELYDPATGHFTHTGRTVLCRNEPLAVLLGSGKVLVIGGGPMIGAHGYDNTMELYTP